MMQSAGGTRQRQRCEIGDALLGVGNGSADGILRRHASLGERIVTRVEVFTVL